MSDSEGDGQWGDWDEGMGDQQTRCLFCDEVLASPQAALSHCAAEHQFDLHGIRRVENLDFYTTMRVLNYIRRHRKEDPSLWTASGSFVYSEHAEKLADDKYLQPVDADDPLLFGFEDDDAEVADGDSGDEGEKPHYDNLSVEDKLAAAEEHIKVLQAMLEANKVLTEQVMAQDDDRSGSDSDGDSDSAENNTNEDNLDYYFESYSWSDIHMTMIKDKVRTDTYRDSMLKNPGLFKDKIVLDIGSGTGILSLFAAKAGAKKVIGIDRSRVVNQAAQIAKRNNLDHIVSFVKGTVETVTLPVDKVDIIISEWMGYALLYESMLDTVLFARDKWLAPGGVVMPDRARIILSGVEDSPDLTRNDPEFWNEVYGFDMQPMKAMAEKEVAADKKNADIYVLPAKHVMTTPSVVKTIDIMTTTAEALDFTGPFNLEMKRDGRLAQLCIYFDIDWIKDCENPVSFSTSPADTPTHWMQAHIRLPEVYEVSKGDVISGLFSVARNNENRRCLDFAVSGALIRAKTDDTINITESYTFQ